VLLGIADSVAARALGDAYREAVLGQVGSWGPWRNFTRLQPRLRALLAAEIAERRERADLPGLLTRLAQARDDEGRPASDAQCEDQVFAMMIAGVDTVAIALAWALHWLARERAARERLAAELVAAPDAGAATVLALPYLDAVFAETLRMYPVVPTPSGRRLRRDTAIGPHLLPAGTTLVPCSYLVHRRAELYPEGGRFRPERFLERRFERHEYFPFGGGVRRCVGEALAELEFKVALATILGAWALEQDDAPPLPPVRSGTLLAPSDALRVRLRPARAAAGGTA
jgi:cytochrome P450